MIRHEITLYLWSIKTKNLKKEQKVYLISALVALGLKLDKKNLDNIHFNPKGGGGGPKVPGGFSIGCHFSQDDAMVTKILDFIHIHPK